MKYVRLVRSISARHGRERQFRCRRVLFACCGGVLPSSLQARLIRLQVQRAATSRVCADHRRYGAQHPGVAIAKARAGCRACHGGSKLHDGSPR